MHRRLLHIPKGILKFVIFLLLLGAGAAVALLRTQAGRDLLGTQIEAAFNNAFAGSMEIGRLRGNALETLYALNVVLFDPQGTEVVRIDSIALKLDFVDLIRRDITISKATLIRPDITMVKSDSSEWNLSDLFRSRIQRTAVESNWKFRSADVVVRDGSIKTVNTGTASALVADGTLFDYTNTRFGDVRGRLTVDWGADDRFVDLLDLGLTMGDRDLTLVAAHGQIVASDTSLSLTSAGIQTNRSRISLSAFAEGFSSLADYMSGRSEERALALHIDATRIDSADMVALFPSSRVSTASFSLDVSGSRDNILIESISVAVGNNEMTGSGSIRGLPDSASFDVNIEQGSLVLRELAALFPALQADRITSIPRQRITATIAGSVHRNDAGSLEIAGGRAVFQTESGIGLIDGDVRFELSADGTAAVSAEIELFDVRAGLLVAELGRQTTLNGQLDASFSRTDSAGFAGTATLVLTESTVRKLRFDRLDFDVGLQDRIVTLQLSGQGETGALEATAMLDLGTSFRRISADIRLTDMDLLLALRDVADDARSAFNAHLEITVAGTSIDDATGFARVTIDTVSFVNSADTVGLPASFHELTLDHSAARETSLRLRGDIFEGELEGSYGFSTLTRVATLWLEGADRTLKAQLAKRLHPEPDDPDSTVVRLTHDLEQQRTADFLVSKGYLDGVHFTGGLRIKRLLELNRLVPLVPAFASNVNLRTAGRITSDEIDLSVWIDADSLRGGNREIDGLVGEIRIDGQYDHVLDDFVKANVQLAATRFGVGTLSVQDVAFTFDYSNHAGTLSLTTANGEEDDLSVGLTADIVVFPDRNELTLTDAHFRTKDYSWTLRPDATLDVYGDAISINHLLIVNVGAETEPDVESEQQLMLHGTISKHYADTLHLDAHRVSLDAISDLGQFKFHIGGFLDAQLSVAKITDQPEAVGELTVSRMTFDGRDVGDLTLNSSYGQKEGVVGINATLFQPRDKQGRVQRFDVLVTGDVRLPSDSDSGELDLAATLGEIDMFFFQYLFPNELRDVIGSASGTGTIRGTLTKPIFDASVQLAESSFLVPEFNLRFGLTGPATIDSLGFHLDNMALSDPTGGTGNVHGSILFNDYRFFSFDVAAELNDIMIMNVLRSDELAFYGEVWVSGTVTLEGPLQQTLMRSTDVVTSQKSRLFLPVTEDVLESDKTFIVFADSTGEFAIEQRQNILSKRPQTERAFVEGMDMRFNITMPEESSVFLVFDALLGDVINARGSGRIQLQRNEGDFAAFGTFTVSSGDYLFTAGEVFQRRFVLDPGGTITWDGDPTDAVLNIPAVFRTRASLAGLPGQNPNDRVPIRVDMNLGGRVVTPEVTLRIALDIDQRESTVIPPGLESTLNQQDLAAEYATSVLLTNTFLLTSSSSADPTASADDLLFNSLSQLVSSQLNRFVSSALNLDVNVGVQQGNTDDEFDVVYGFALRLDDEGLIIRGEGLYETTTEASSSEGLQGKFVVEYRLAPSVWLELFFRRQSDLYRAASSLGTAYGAGLVYQTDFANWKAFGRKSVDPPKTEDETPVVPSEGNVPKE